MDEGQEYGSIDIPLKLFIVMPLHAKWLIEMYNEMTLAKGRQVFSKGWQVACIKYVVKQGLLRLPCLNPF